MIVWYTVKTKCGKRAKRKQYEACGHTVGECLWRYGILWATTKYGKISKGIYSIFKHVDTRLESACGGMVYCRQVKDEMWEDELRNIQHF